VIEKRYTITTDATLEVELLLTRFERDRERGPVQLIDYTPPADDPAYGPVVTELSRIDLEHAFNEGTAPDANRYIRLFPHVFENAEHRSRLAFEEYRLRRRGGESVSGTEIGDRYAVDGSRWPQLQIGSGEARPSRSITRHFSQHDLAPPIVHYPTVGDTFAGYQLLNRLGEGAFSRVFLARQSDLASRMVVLKVTPLSTDESDRLATLQHTSIIPVYSVHREGDLSCICMPFLGATTLADLATCGKRWASLSGPAEELVSTILDRRRSTIWASNGLDGNPPGGQSEQTTAGHDERDVSSAASSAATDELSEYSRLGYVDALLKLVTGAVEGLAHAHRRGIIHRDLKPANILVADDGNPVLLDFNLAVSCQAAETRVVGGTLPYMSPQQLEALQTGDAADRRDDVFSIGVILYELLSGHLPFDCPQHGQGFALESVIADRRHRPKSLRLLNSGVSPGLESIVDRCLAPDREQRYRDASELAIDLSRHRQHRALKFAPERSTRERLAKWTARHPRMSSASSVAIVAAALIAICLALLWQRGQRLARLNVEANFQHLQHDLPRAIASLSSPGREPEVLSSGLEESAQLMSPWLAKSGPSEPVTGAGHLEPPARKQLRKQLARLAYLMARAERDVAAQATDPEASKSHRPAEDWNRIAATLDPQLRALTQRPMRAVELQSDRDAIDEDQPTLLASADIDVRAMFAAESGDPALWRKLIDQQLDQQPTNVTHWFNLAIAHGRLGDTDSAAACFDVSNRLQPDSIAILLNRGICNLDRGEPALAARDFSACLDLDPQLMVPRFNRAVAAHRVGDHQAALGDLNHLVNQGHATTRVVLMRGKVHQSLGDRAAAEADHHAALSIAPRDVNDWVARGVSRLADSPHDALADFNAALRIRANAPRALNNAAHVYAEVLNQPQLAIPLLTRLVENRPQSASAVASRGILFARLGNSDAALNDARAASELSPTALQQLQIAGIHALVSEQSARETNRDAALQWLALALRGDVALAQIAKRDADLACLRDDPRFSRLLGNAMMIEQQSDEKSNGL
jgi:serine/threonine protein kinase/tetratricopeptide (TPR) repeat protein